MLFTSGNSVPTSAESVSQKKPARIKKKSSSLLCCHKLCFEELLGHLLLYQKFKKKKKREIISGNGTEPLLLIIFKFGVTSSGCKVFPLGRNRAKEFHCCELSTAETILFISIIYHNKNGMSLSSKSRHKAYEVVYSRCRYNEKKGSRIDYSYKE